MGQALYRKYRSRAFGEVIGQEHITDTLQRALKAGRINHAYLLTGPHGVGKTSIARILAFMINELPYSDTPHLDIIEIDAASNRRIDDIRDLREKVHIAPVSAKYKVYIIDEVHMLTGESFNALLKTLEEPPSHVVFILATTEVHKLPATIISRTQRFTFKPAERTKIAAHLRDIASKEDIKITNEALDLIAEHSEGSFRDSVSLLDQLVHTSAGEITAQDVSHTLGLAPQAAIDALASALSNKSTQDALTAVRHAQETMTNTATVVSQLARRLNDIAPKQHELYTLINQLVDVPRAYMPDLKFMSTIMTYVGDDTSAKSAEHKDKESKHVQPLAAAPTFTASTPIAEVKAVQKQKAIEKTQADTPPPKPATPDPVAEIPLTGFDLTQWAAVLSAVKKASPPLYSVAKQAMPVFDEPNNTLVLKFKYQLHGKKLDDVKQKAHLSTILQGVLGATPVIKIDIDKTAQAPNVAVDAAVSSVAAIMGGGEVVDAEAI